MWGRLTRIILQSLPRYPFPSRPSFLLSCRRVYSHLSWHMWLLHFVRFLFVYLLDFVRHRVRVLRKHDVVMLSLFRHVISRRCSAFSKVDFGREGNAELCTFFLAGDVCLRPPFFFEDFNLSKLMWSMSYADPFPAVTPHMRDCSPLHPLSVLLVLWILCQYFFLFLLRCKSYDWQTEIRM